MFSYYYIIKNNLKRKKSDAAVIAFLITLATLLLYTSSSVLGNTYRVIDSAGEKCNHSDHMYVTSDAGAKMAKELYEASEEVAEYEISPIIFCNASFYPHQNAKKKEFMFFLSSIEEERKINKINISEQGEKKDNSIILPYCLHTSNGYKIGDKFYMDILDHTCEFEVLGFAEDPQFATAINISMYRCYISQTYIDRLFQQDSRMDNFQYQECKAILKSGTDVYKFVQNVTQELDDRDKDVIIGLIYETMRGGVAMISNISMGITLTFSVVLIGIALIIIRFSIKNFIEENRKNIGTLQALGYTSRQLQVTILLEMGMITVAGCILGLILCFSCSSFVGNLEASMIGLRYHMGLDGIYIIRTLGAVFISVLLLTYFCSREYKKVHVLDALRGGISTHNFKKNTLSLEKTHLPLHIAIGMKHIFGAKLKNLGILFIASVLSFACCIGFFLYDNFAKDTDYLIDLSGFETGTAVIAGKNMDEISADMEKWQEIECVNNYQMADLIVSKGEKTSTVTCDIWKDMNALEHVTLLEGHLPEYDNEILITRNVSKILDAKAGDVVYLDNNGKKLSYIVSGIDQKINNMGMKMMMNYEGIKRLTGTAKTMQIYVYVKDGYGYQEIHDKIMEHYPDVSVVDVKKQSGDALSLISLVMEMICVLFVSITLFVVVLVVFLVVKVKVIRERKNNGIYKAIGCTTANLILQTIMSNLPVITTGAAAGAIISIFAANPAVVLFLSFCGIENCSLSIDVKWLFFTVLGMALTAFLTAFFASARMRKIEPVKMLVEE